MSYLEWLISLISKDGTHRLSEEEAGYLHGKPFEVVISTDENRADDGRVFRDIYEAETGNDSNMGNRRCTMLEMMIALARHMTDEMYDWLPDSNNSIGRWFCEMLDNIEKPRNRSSWDEYRWDDALEMIINRTYSPDGSGGLFPRISPKVDQRVVDIWDQMNGYLIDWYA